MVMFHRFLGRQAPGQSCSSMMLLGAHGLEGLAAKAEKSRDLTVI